MSDSTTPSSVSPAPHPASGRPRSDAFKAFMMSEWAPRAPLDVAPLAAAPFTAVRRTALSAQFPGARLVVPAGPLRPRSNDDDYRFRPHSAFAHLTGLGTDQEPDAVLVFHPVSDATGETHHAALYVRPLAPRDAEEFYADARYGEFWVGARPTLENVTTSTGIEARHIDELHDALAKDVGDGGTRLLVVPGADESVEALVEAIRATSTDDPKAAGDEDLDRALSELRLIKDDFEIAQMRTAVDATIDGFAQVVRALPRAGTHRRGERVVETVFDAHARLEGNAVGYSTIAAAGEHATTLHWTTNTGDVRPGELILVDAGVEVDSLYTADVTRTLPINAEFTEVQRRVYQAVLDAADAAFAVARPGARFGDVHAAAMDVIAARLEEWNILPVSAAEALTAEGQQHRRWMVHGTSHHLGLDVHDCARARNELYMGGILRPGMVFTIEPGLYFKADDLAVPSEYRGIGVRIEDDVLITEDGHENLSAALPREPGAVEAWMRQLLG